MKSLFSLKSGVNQNPTALGVSGPYYERLLSNNYYWLKVKLDIELNSEVSCFLHNTCGVLAYRLGHVSVALKHFEAALVIEIGNGI